MTLSVRYRSSGRHAHFCPGLFGLFDGRLISLAAEVRGSEVCGASRNVSTTRVWNYACQLWPTSCRPVGPETPKADDVASQPLHVSIERAHPHAFGGLAALGQGDARWLYLPRGVSCGYVYDWPKAVGKSSRSDCPACGSAPEAAHTD